jgi:signal transduction histidine kinase
VVELESTLEAIRNSLAVGAAVTTLGSALFGLAVSRRVLRPLREVADTAERIAEGDLSARLDAGNDPDLVPLLASFNHMADALDDRIERERRFAADVSHELRTPLTAMNSAVHLIERRADQLSGTGQQAVEVLRGQVEKFSRLVLEILDLSRLEADLADVDLEDVDLRALLGAVADEHGVDPAAVDLDPSAPARVRTDPRRLRVILRNLLENAERYGDGCVRLGVAAAGDRVVFEVDDAGPGLGGDDPARLFERFHRGSVARQRGTGTGLGLALVAENARALGGSVSATDLPGRGARFIVLLPRRVVTADVAPAADTALTAGPA